MEPTILVKRNRPRARLDVVIRSEPLVCGDWLSSAADVEPLLLPLEFAAVDASLELEEGGDVELLPVAGEAEVEDDDEELWAFA